MRIRFLVILYYRGRLKKKSKKKVRPTNWPKPVDEPLGAAPPPKGQGTGHLCSSEHISSYSL